MKLTKSDITASKLKDLVESELTKRINESKPKTADLPTIQENTVDVDTLMDEISENTLDIVDLAEQGKSSQLQAKVNETLDKLFLKESVVIDINESEEEIVEANIITKVNSKGVKRKRLSCGPGRKLQNGVCVIVQGSEKIDKHKGAIKAARTKRSQGAGYAMKVARKTKIAMRKRKGLGL